MAEPNKETKHRQCALRDGSTAGEQHLLVVKSVGK